MFLFGKRWQPATIVLLFVAAMLTGCGQTERTGTANTVSSEQLRQVNQLNDAADEMYRYVMDGNIVKARDKLDELGVKMTEIRFEGITTVEGVGALSDAIVQAKRALQSVNYSESEGQAAAAKIRLATDALTHINKPMWLQYYKGMKESANRIVLSGQKQNSKESLAELEQLQFRYDTIRPSLFISRQPSDVEKMDSLFSFLRGQLSQAEVNWKQVGGGLSQLQPSLDELFQQRDEAAFVPIVERESPIPLIVSLGSIIVAVLAFAAWRIFKFEHYSFGGGNRRSGR